MSRRRVVKTGYGYVYHHNPDIDNLKIRENDLFLPTKSNPDIVVEMGVKNKLPLIKNVHYPDYMDRAEVESKAKKVIEKEKDCPVCKRAEDMMKNKKKSFIARPHVIKKLRGLNANEDFPLAAVGRDAIKELRDKRPRLIRLGKRRRVEE